MGSAWEQEVKILEVEAQSLQFDKILGNWNKH